MVVLPAPLRPTRPIRSPGCTRRVAPESRMREPARSSRSLAVIMRGLRDGVGNEEGGPAGADVPRTEGSPRRGAYSIRITRPGYRAPHPDIPRRVTAMTEVTGDAGADHGGDLAGRAALVTGASRGIGLAIAAELLARGASVAITGRKVPDLEAAAAELGAP